MEWGEAFKHLSVTFSFLIQPLCAVGAGGVRSVLGEGVLCLVNSVIAGIYFFAKLPLTTQILPLLSTHLYPPVLLPAVHSLLADQRVVRHLVVL